MLPAILIVAFAIRLIGLSWGLPNELHNQSYHPDEQVIWAYAQQIEPAKLDFTPGFYNYGTLYLTVMRVTTDMVSAYRGGPDPADPNSVWQFVGACHFAGRLISALAGAIACGLVFLLLRRVTHPLGAGIGGALAAVAPAWVVHSRFQTVDALATCLLIASLYASVRLLDDPQPLKWALWAGAFAGLSTGTKYTGVLALFALAAALAYRSRAETAFAPWTKLGLAVAVWAGVFVLATPGVLLESSAFLRDVQYEMIHTKTGHGLIFERAGSSFIYHILNLVQGLHPVPLIVGFGGIVTAILTKQRFAFVVLAYALPYYILIGRAEIAFIRYTLPIILVVAIFVGWLAGEMHRKGGRGRWVVGAAILSVGAAAVTTSDFTALMVARDGRDVLSDWLKKESGPDTVVGLVSDPWFYTPPLFPNSTIMRGRQMQQFAEMAMASNPRPVRYLPPDPTQRFDWDVRLLDELSPDYVVFSSFEVGPVARLSEFADQYQEVRRFVEFHHRLEATYDPIPPSRLPPSASLSDRYRAANLLVHDLEYVRPLLWVWKRKTPASPTP